MAKSPEEFELDFSLESEERMALVESIAELTNEWMVPFTRAPNWQEARLYMPLVGMLGALRDPSLSDNQLGHARRMIAHEYVGLPKDAPRPRNTNAFLKAIRQEAGLEIKQTRGFKGDTDMMPASYNDALEDLGSLKERMTLDPSILRLAATLREVRRTGRLNS